jgi:outer membrane biosynthesis protein TonB
MPQKLARNRLAARALRLDTATSIADRKMQFLVYLTVLMVSISTVLLEVHWLTSPPPQPKPAVQAASVSPPPTVEGPTAALSPVYPKPAETTPATPSSEPQSQPQQSQPSSNAAAAPAAVAANPEPQKPAAETTGVATRVNESKESATASAASVPATTSNNHCDVQACSSAYQSFRASDCTYQPFEGARRVCEKASVQHTARDQTERPERRQWSRDVTPRDSGRTVGRRVYDDPDESDADDDDDSDRISVFRARGPRW